MVFHLDYLKLTVFADVSEVQILVERALLEKAGFDEPAWEEKGPASRWERIVQGPGPVTLLVPKAALEMYTMIELKGEACTRFGSDVLLAFIATLDSMKDLRWNGKRVDLTFDHVSFTPKMVDEAIVADNLNSRCLGILDRDWNENSDGQTAYLGRRKSAKLRRLRVYNMRGFNRFEAEFVDEWANSAIRNFARRELVDWPNIALAQIRGMVDFVDHAQDPRSERCPMLPWWKDFVGDVEKIRTLGEEERRKQHEEDEQHVMGQSEGRIMRAARSLWPIRQAFGDEYVLKRLDHYCEGRIRPEDEALAKTLQTHQYCGLAGLPTERYDGDEVA